MFQLIAIIVSASVLGSSVDAAGECKRFTDLATAVLATDDNYVSQNATVYCNYAPSGANITTLTWSMKKQGDKNWARVYYADTKGVSDGIAGAGHNVDGYFVNEQTHALLIKNLTATQNGSIVACSLSLERLFVDEFECTKNVVDSNHLDLIVSEPRTAGPPTLRQEDGRGLVSDGMSIMVGDKLICRAESAPKSKVELYGSAVQEPTTEERCERESDDGMWACSVSATFAQEGHVICKATFLGEEMCAGNCISGINILAKQDDGNDGDDDGDGDSDGEDGGGDGDGDSDGDSEGNNDGEDGGGDGDGDDGNGDGNGDGDGDGGGDGGDGDGSEHEAQSGCGIAMICDGGRAIAILAAAVASYLITKFDVAI